MSAYEQYYWGPGRLRGRRGRLAPAALQRDLSLCQLFSWPFPPLPWVQSPGPILSIQFWTPQIWGDRPRFGLVSISPKLVVFDGEDCSPIPPDLRGKGQRRFTAPPLFALWRRSWRIWGRSGILALLRGWRRLWGGFWLDIVPKNRIAIFPVLRIQT